MDQTITEELAELTDALAKEFREIRDHARVAEIFDGQYVYDSDLPIPSPNFISLITFAVLGDGALLQELETQTAEEGRKLIVGKFQETSDRQAQFLAELESRRRLMIRHLYSTDSVGDGVADWCHLVDELRYNCDPSSVIRRAVVQEAIERLVARAILLGKFTSLEGLARAVKESYLDMDSGTPNPAREIAGYIVWNQPILQEHVDWPVSKEAVKLLVLALYPEVSEHPTTWAKAWKMFPPEFTPRAGTAKLSEPKRAEIIRLAEIMKNRE